MKIQPMRIAKDLAWLREDESKERRDCGVQSTADVICHERASNIKEKASNILPGFLIVLLVASLLCPQIAAQTQQGDILGTVRDSQEQVIAGANVSIINEATSAVRAVVTDDRGDYLAAGFFPGSYRVEVTMQGFKKVLVPGVRVEPQSKKRVDVTLEVGELATELTVTAPLVKTEGSTISVDMPRILFEKPMSNVSRSGWGLDPAMWTSGSSGGGGLFLFGGVSSARATEYQVEGAQQNIAVFIPPQAVENVTIVTGTPSAEYGRPVTSNITFRSGTNKLHGEYSLSLKNPAVNAVNTVAGPQIRPVGKSNWRHEFAVSGPVHLPKVYDGRDKTFFFFDYWTSPYRDFYPASTTVGTTTVPTQRMIQGDFSRYVDGQGRLIPITDPTTGQPFQNNVIPTPRLSSVALKFIQDYIGGYGNPVVRVGDPDSLLNNASRNGLLDGRYWNWAAKVDQNIGNKHVISFSWNHYNRWAYQEGLLDNYPQHRISFGHTYSITPRIANQLRVAVARHHPTNTAVWGDYDRRPVTGGEFLKRWGIEGVADPGIGGAPQMTGIPLLSSRTQLRSVAQSAFTDDIRTQVYENLSYMTSGHTIKGGMAIINSTEDVLYHPGYGTFAFDGRFTGVQLADFLLGLPASSSRGESRPNVARRIREYAAYIQDDWRVTSKLTVSYGIRWDRYPPATEANGLYFNFDPASGKMLVPDQAALSRISKLWPTATLPVVLGSSLSYPEKLTSPTQRWLPRLSLAYRPTGGDFVIRGGFGVYNSILRYEALQTSGPFALTEVVYNEMIPQANGTFAPKYSFPNPFGAAVGVPASVPTGASVAKDLRPEYTMTWNLSGEKAILPSMALRVSYIGNKGTQLIHSFNMNTPLLSTQPFSQSRRPFPAYGNITRTENGLNSNYNALQFIVTRPAQKGLYLEASYTLQRGYVTATDYAWNRSRDRGRDGNWPTHDLIANFAFDLPFGPNQRWLSQAQGGKWVLARIVGGWSATGLFNWHSGRRSTPSYSGYDSGNINQASGRPDLVPGCNLYTRPSKLTSTLPWVNIACFTPPANGTLGNAPRNLLEGPAMWVISMSPFKEFLLPRWEGAKLRIGAQIYNILNSSSYWGEPNGNIGVYSRQADGSLVLRTPTYPLVSSGNWIRRGTENLGQRQFIFMAAIMF